MKFEIRKKKRCNCEQSKFTCKKSNYQMKFVSECRTSLKSNKFHLILIKSRVSCLSGENRCYEFRDEGGS